MFSYQELLFSAAMAAYIATCVIIAVVRWGHRCEAHRHNMDYHFPAWRTIIYCFLTNLLLLPVVFMPADPDAQMLVRILLIMGSPYFCAMLIFTYFGKVLGINTWKRPLYALSFPVGIVVAVGLLCVVMPGTQMEGRFVRALVSLSGILAIAELVSFFVSLSMVARAMRRFSSENYSNLEDFPQHYAARVIWLPIIHVFISWVASFIGTLPVMSVGVFLLAVLSVYFLIGALSPHRRVDVQNVKAAMVKTPASADTSDILSPARKNEIVAAIRRCVEEKKAFLDSHLTLTSLSRDCGVNRTYLSAVMNERLGGFFSYVNRCRLAHAATLRVQHPEYSVEELATSSGFSSRQTYYNVLKKLKD